MTKKRKRDPLTHLHPPLASLPKTLPEAVSYVIGTLSQEDQDALRDCPCEYLGEFHHGLGTWVRNQLGLWGRNEELVANLPNEHRFGDAASWLILEEVWLRLQELEAKPSSADVTMNVTPLPDEGRLNG